MSQMTTHIFTVPVRSFSCPNQFKILTVETDGDGVIATFSDGTTAGYVAEELLKLRPKREPTEDGQEKVGGKTFSSRERGSTYLVDADIAAGVTFWR